MDYNEEHFGGLELGDFDLCEDCPEADCSVCYGDIDEESGPDKDCMVDTPLGELYGGE